MATRIWKFLTTDIKDLLSTDTVEGTVEVASATFGLAETLQKSEIQKLAPIIYRGASLLDVLNSPLAELAESTLPFVKIATSLLKFYLEQTKTEPTLAQAIALVGQAAYLESFRAILRLPRVRQWLSQSGHQPASEVVQQQFKRLGELELDDQSARLALLCFHESKLAQAFNEVLSARLAQLDLPAANAIQIAEQVARTTDQQLLPALITAGNSVKRLVTWYQVGGLEVLAKYTSIDTYLDEQIKPRPLEHVFGEDFRFRDIYIPLKAQPLNAEGAPSPDQAPVDLETWAETLLNDTNKGDRVLFIQGGPGRGKSVFCRMFADWVRQHEHPRWTPILIRLRDLETVGKDFEAMLRQVVDRDFAQNDPGWLTDRNIRFLFLLDGFDELLMEGRTSGGLEEFLRQVGRFQESCAHNSEKGHRVLMTGRSLSLQSIERLMPSNLERVEILPMDDDLQDRWLTQWGKLNNANPIFLKKTLRDQRLPNQVQELAREPLLLYLLAAMHRARELRLEMFDGASAAGAKVLIYQRTLDWVLTKQRDALLKRRLTELELEGLHRILAEAGLCVIQAGGESAPIAMLEERLKTDDHARKLLEEAGDRLQDSPLRNALAAFYMQPGKKGSGTVEFVHKSFSEFLCAKCLKEALEDWSKLGDKRREFYVTTEQMDWEIYDLLGYNTPLRPEIVEYLMVLLEKSAEFHPVFLFRRLENFYLRWCNGDFIDAAPENLPQRKMRFMREQLNDQHLGQRHRDVAAGLNVMILLFELHRYAQAREQLKRDIYFHPCGKQDTQEFDRKRLLRIANYCNCLNTDAFNTIVSPYLNKTDLSDADLSYLDISGVNLSAANLKNASLRYANLSAANLQGANLERAVLHNADLSYADFYKAKLTGAWLLESRLVKAVLTDADLQNARLSDANLFAVNLENANLTNADLSKAILSANLSGANFSKANLQDLRYNLGDDWRTVKGLETAKNVPEALKKQAGLK
jgi:uncharacterized protein YjbI with pentapeptide repeats